MMRKKAVGKGRKEGRNGTIGKGFCELECIEVIINDF